MTYNGKVEPGLSELGEDAVLICLLHALQLLPSNIQQGSTLATSVQVGLGSNALLWYKYVA